MWSTSKSSLVSIKVRVKVVKQFFLRDEKFVLKEMKARQGSKLWVE